MVRFCTNCGTTLATDARFCGSCGSFVAAQADAAAEPPPQTPPVASAETETFQPDTAPIKGKRTNWLLIGGSGGILALLALYYAIFIRDDVSSPREVPDTAKAEEAPASDAEKSPETTRFAVAEANIRDRATMQGSKVVGKIARGTEISGKLVTGEDGSSQWLELAGGRGFVGIINLAESAPPQIVKTLGDRLWIADRNMDILSAPNADAQIIDKIAAGSQVALFALTANGYIEIKRKSGGVGYIADGQRIAALSNARGKPISISFNTANCNFGGELEAEFAKVGRQSQAEYDKISNAEYPSNDARQAALEAIETKSHFQRLERSYNGLSITGIGVHYESQSVYFADSPEKVIAAFRAAGYKVGNSGHLPSSDAYSAAIAAANGDARKFGKTDFGCGL